MGFREKSAWKKFLYIILFYPTLIVGLIFMVTCSYSVWSFIGWFIVISFVLLFIKGCIESYND